MEIRIKAVINPDMLDELKNLLSSCIMKRSAGIAEEWELLMAFHKIYACSSQNMLAPTDGDSKYLYAPKDTYLRPLLLVLPEVEACAPHISPGISYRALCR